MFFVFDFYVSFIGFSMSVYMFGMVNGGCIEQELPFVKKHLKILVVMFLLKTITN